MFLHLSQSFCPTAPTESGSTLTEDSRKKQPKILIIIFLFKLTALYMYYYYYCFPCVFQYHFGETKMIK